MRSIIFLLFLATLYFNCSENMPIDMPMEPEMEIDTMEVEVLPKAIIEEIGMFSNEINECSGMINIDGRILSMNDGTNHTLLQEINPNTAELLATINIAQSSNIDWEALQFDNGNIYIADTGNNDGDRDNLSIYTVPYQDGTEMTCIDTINFIWPDQTEFISSNSHAFDCEAIIVDGDMITFFTKNRNDLKTNIYRLNLTTEEIVKGESINITGLSTDATKDPSGDIILLSYITFNGNTFSNKINILSQTDGVYSLKESIPISPNSQIEAIVHIEDHKYLLGAESENNEGGYLYALDLSEFYN